MKTDTKRALGQLGAFFGGVVVATLSPIVAAKVADLRQSADASPLSRMLMSQKAAEGAASIGAATAPAIVVASILTDQQNGLASLFAIGSGAASLNWLFYLTAQRGATT